MIDIRNFTDANTGKDCAITNPTGGCCGAEISKILQWAKQKQLEIDPPLMEQSISHSNAVEKATKNSYDKSFEKE